ncbi:MAG: alpha/beta fold hydrolase [Myxococcales bacterium]
MMTKLPAPPDNPQRSPATAVPGESPTTLVSTGGTLHARVATPHGASRAVVLCHPHPLYGGSMHSPVPLAIARALESLGGGTVGWLRFNFRGVPPSEGTYDQGQGEVDDAVRAIVALRERLPGVPITVVGHSFGSWVGLEAAKADGAVERVVLVAPSTRFFQFAGERPTMPVAIVLGDQDDYCDVAEGHELARRLGASMEVLEGFDHHFLKSRRVMAEKVFGLAVR